MLNIIKYKKYEFVKCLLWEMVMDVMGLICVHCGYLRCYAVSM